MAMRTQGPRIPSSFGHPQPDEPEHPIRHIPMLKSALARPIGQFGSAFSRDGAFVVDELPPSPRVEVDYVEAPVLVEHVVSYVGKVEPLKPSELNQETTIMDHPSLLVLAGTGCAVIVTVIMFWDGVTLLGTTNFRLWAGVAWPWASILLCLAVVNTTAVTLALLARKRMLTPEVIFEISVYGVLMTGLLFVLVSIPLSFESSSSYMDLVQRCSVSSGGSRELEVYSSRLNALRAQPDCMMAESVTECPGFEDLPGFTAYLQYMESTYACTGFCPGVADNSPNLFSKGRASGDCATFAAQELKFSSDQVARTGFSTGMYYMVVASLALVLAVFPHPATIWIAKSKAAPKKRHTGSIGRF